MFMKIIAWGPQVSAEQQTNEQTDTQVRTFTTALASQLLSLLHFYLHLSSIVVLLFFSIKPGCQPMQF